MLKSSYSNQYIHKRNENMKDNTFQLKYPPFLIRKLIISYQIRTYDNYK